MDPKGKVVRRFFVGALLVSSFFACRENMPDGDPQTPANSPLPKIERPQSEPSTPTTSDMGGDGGK